MQTCGSGSGIVRNSLTFIGCQKSKFFRFLFSFTLLVVDLPRERIQGIF